MESVLLLTVLGAIIGIYTILPDYKKLRLGYSIGKLDLLILGILVLVMLSVLIFSSYLQSSIVSATTFNQLINPLFNHNIQINNYLFQKSFNYQFLTDLLNIVSIILIFVVFLDKTLTKKIHINNKKYFIDKLDELFYKGEYTTVFSLIEDNYKNVMEFKKKYNKKGHSKLSKEIEILIKEIENSNNDHNKKEKVSFYGNLKSKFNFLWEKSTYETIYEQFKITINNISEIKYFKSDNSLQESIKFRLLDYEYIKKVVKYNPYFGLNIIIDDRLNSLFRQEYANLYFRELMKNQDSILYREIKNTTSGLHRYEISENNKIMHQIFSNINKADEARVHRPIGNLTIDLLNKQYKKPYDEYNEYNDKLIDSPDRLNDPLFMAVHFFDIMIRESIYQDVRWHMWLYYYESFVGKIVRNYKINDPNKFNYEFPNVYSFLLYEIFDNLIGWIKLVEITTNAQKELKNTEYDNCENENIIKSSINCLYYCIEHILKPNNISRKFKVYLMENVFYLYFELFLSDEKIVNEYGQVLENCLLTASKNIDDDKILIQALNNIEVYKLSNKASVFEIEDSLKNKLMNS